MKRGGQQSQSSVYIENPESTKDRDDKKYETVEEDEDDNKGTIFKGLSYLYKEAKKIINEAIVGDSTNDIERVAKHHTPRMTSIASLVTAKGPKAYSMKKRALRRTHKHQSEVYIERSETDVVDEMDRLQQKYSRILKLFETYAPKRLSIKHNISSKPIDVQVSLESKDIIIVDNNVVLISKRAWHEIIEPAFKEYSIYMTRVVSRFNKMKNMKERAKREKVIAGLSANKRAEQNQANKMKDEVSYHVPSTNESFQRDVVAEVYDADPNEAQKNFTGTSFGSQMYNKIRNTILPVTRDDTQQEGPEYIETETDFTGDIYEPEDENKSPSIFSFLFDEESDEESDDDDDDESDDDESYENDFSDEENSENSAAEDKLTTQNIVIDLPSTLSNATVNGDYTESELDFGASYENGEGYLSTDDDIISRIKRILSSRKLVSRENRERIDVSTYYVLCTKDRTIYKYMNGVCEDKLRYPTYFNVRNSFIVDKYDSKTLYNMSGIIFDYIKTQVERNNSELVKANVNSNNNQSHLVASSTSYFSSATLKSVNEFKDKDEVIIEFVNDCLDCLKYSQQDETSTDFNTDLVLLEGVSVWFQCVNNTFGSLNQGLYIK
jgi:hypothetical protein